MKKPRLRRKDTATKRKLSKIKMKTFNFAAISNSIPMEDFSAMELAGLIPKKYEFEDLTNKDLEENVLKLSNGYGANFPTLNG